MKNNTRILIPRSGNQSLNNSLNTLSKWSKMWKNLKGEATLNDNSDDKKLNSWGVISVIHFVDEKNRRRLIMNGNYRRKKEKNDKAQLKYYGNWLLETLTSKTDGKLETRKLVNDNYRYAQRFSNSEPKFPRRKEYCLYKSFLAGENT